jgi:hypothetical protein
VAGITQLSRVAWGPTGGLCSAVLAVDVFAVADAKDVQRRLVLPEDDAIAADSETVLRRVIASELLDIGGRVLSRYELSQSGEHGALRDIW